MFLFNLPIMSLYKFLLPHVVKLQERVILMHQPKFLWKSDTPTPSPNLMCEHLKCLGKMQTLNFAEQALHLIISQVDLKYTNKSMKNSW